MSGNAKPIIPPKFYKIGEVMAYTGLSRQTVHNYTILGLLREEARTPSGHRLYGEDTFVRIARIRELQKTKTLKDIVRILKVENPSVGSEGEVGLARLGEV
jgi:DNA-binding transcriptional MerR regulator